MTDTHKDGLAGLLFGQSKKKLLNLKLCRGDAPHVSSDLLRQETHFALTQVAGGACESFVDFPENRLANRMDLAAIASI
ncbi:hypothetical protein [Sphingomonas parapaucimobilis]|uniref:Uncharacterized protein n=1 Tax=Sphingomonas parapaucimobilis NBRC 15100 TaxID=1219049 RepID=A0A0A1WAJ1_9SPHN|nr:hypothetical protein [Sphingomonas parapaucimobilis]GAM01954.1 hypothetical protein SP5_070_00370 [Sphingomonas parapaucimobilis NBRC 15100]